MKLVKNNIYLLLIDEEAEIKENSWYESNGVLFISDNKYDEGNNPNMKGLNNSIIAHSPLTKEAKELDLPLLPEFEENVEELACNIYDLSLDEYEYIKEDLCQNRSLLEYHYSDMGREEIPKKYFDVTSFIAGYNTAQSKQFSLEDMKKALNLLSNSYSQGYHRDSDIDFQEATAIIQQIQQSKIPVGFEPEFNYIICEECDGAGWTAGCKSCKGYGRIETTKLRTTTNSEGKEVLIGEYKF